ncbi:MAG: hypothetical protein ABSA59_13455, partial [Terriglobia bacterium]
MLGKCLRLSPVIRVFIVFAIMGPATILWNLRDNHLCAAQEQPFAYMEWPSEPPAGCPFQKSTDITGVAFTGRHIRYANADTWYPSWAANGNMYSPWTDGRVNGVRSNSGGRKATTGYATILGD